MTTPVYQINCGGPLVSPYVAGAPYLTAATGSQFSTATAVSTAGTINPAPMAVYQTEQYGGMTWTFPSLTPGGIYTVRLHFAEIFHTAPGQRTMNVMIQGVTVLSNYDVFVAAGGNFKAVIPEFPGTVADGTGNIVISYISVIDSAKASAIEIVIPDQGVSVFYINV